MAGINLDQVKTELGNYFRTNNKEVRGWVYGGGSQLAKHARTITSVKGKFPAFRSVTDHVVQGFRAQWDALGTTKFKVNDLVNYHQKVNFPVVPADVLNSWLAELYTEGKTPDQHPISQYIAQKELGPKVQKDIAELEIRGVYDANDAQTYGKSMNGINKVLKNGIASSDNPMYKIPLPAVTESNISDVLIAFEKNIPAELESLITKIFVSKKHFKWNKLDMINKYGNVVWMDKNNTMRTVLGDREIVPLDFDNEGMIWATPDGNLLKLIDVVDQPQVTDIQVADYTVKIFMEFHLGYAFWINEAVCVGVTQGSGSGLTTDNSLYFS